MKFAKKQLSCIGCKALISKGTLCSHCKGREAELYCETVSQVAAAEEFFQNLWVQCRVPGFFSPGYALAMPSYMVSLPLNTFIIKLKLLSGFTFILQLRQCLV
ncbi:hypothetical protein Dsin_028707 [Dipteronia sinensis]|uniref:C4-type zinc-finger of DNA polymerase delta domain-containing protein n=1 Tax=Dipteronia sinensis TaxID=43782 RepID=A0AAE0DUT3_9ROSI|nr:hypothetical protein Dsin_028707 [Dipteronia sinensis]